MINSLLVGVAFLAAGLGPAAGARASGIGSAFESADGPYLYVANQASASVTVIDVMTDEVVRTIDLTRLGFSENAKPHELVPRVLIRPSFAPMSGASAITGRSSI